VAEQNDPFDLMVPLGDPPAEEEAEAPPVETPPVPGRSVGLSSGLEGPRGDVFEKMIPLGPQATTGEKARAVGQGLATGAVRTGAITAGAVGGAIVGAAAFPPAAPITGTIGGILGAIGGYFFGEVAVEDLADPDFSGPITFRTLDDVPAELRPYAVFGETVGSFVAPTGAVVGVARSRLRIIIDPMAGRFKRFTGGLINRILDMAGSKTRRFVATETGAAGGAATAGMLAQVAAPDQPGVRLGAEIVGGFANPSRLFLGVGTDTFNRLIGFAKRNTVSGRQNKAGQFLQDFLREHGEDPDLLAALLRAEAENLVPGAQPTVAQALGSDAMSAFEAQFAEINRAFGRAAEIQARQTLDSMAAAIVILRGPDASPAMLVEAGRIQETAYRLLLQQGVDEALDTATTAARGIPGSLDETMRSTLSRAAEETLSTSLKGARAVERGLYDATESVTLQTMAPLFTQERAIATEMLERAQLPTIIVDTLADYRVAQQLMQKARALEINPAQMGSKAARAFLKENGITAKEFRAIRARFTTAEVTRFRSEVLELARKANKDGLENLSRRLGLLAEAALDTIDNGYTLARKQGFISREVSDAYDRARTFSRSLHDTYTRAYTGVAKVVGRRGELVTPPEALLHNALATGPELRASRFRELQEATEFLIRQTDEGIDIPAEEMASVIANGQKMFDTQQSFLRLAAAEVIGKDGRVSPQLIFKFLRSKAELLERFPVVRELLESAQTSEEALAALQRSTQMRLRPDQIASQGFAQAARVEAGADAVKVAIGSSNPRPIESLEALVEVARRGGPQVSDSLRASIFDHIIETSLRNDQKGVSLPKLIVGLTKPIRPGLESMLEFMVRTRLLTEPETAIINQVIVRARSITQAVSTQATGERILGGGAGDILGAGIDILLRMTGATIATQIAGLAPGTATTGRSLIVAQSGSKMMRQVFQRLPAIHLEDILKAALRGDPLPGQTERFGLAIALLEAPKTAHRAIQLSRQIHAYAITSLLTFVSRDDQYVEDQTPPVFDLMRDINE
jgi:hypothetical protein